VDSSELSGTATAEKPEPKPALAAGGKGKGGRNPFRRIGRLYREVLAELRKVLWPTRKELLSYTAVVLVFVTAMVLVVAGLDFVFSKAVIAVFG
jgi:preprotein translocase subunit SecE